VAGPIADFSHQAWVAVGDTVRFDGTVSTSSDNITAYRWRIQGDTLKQGDSLEVERIGAKVTHQFSKPGVYPVTLTVTTDAKTACNQASITKVVRVNAPPTLAANVPQAVAVGERFLLDASQSFDPDGIVTKYEWKADGKPIGTTPKVAHVFEKPGNHQIEVTITDDSPTRTKSVTQVFNVFANAAPKPEIVLPSPIYENERIALVPRPLQDADGDTLRFSWLIDGKLYKDELVQFSAGRHLIQLNADDQRNLLNSRDSLLKEVQVLPPPPFPTSLPKHIVQGTTIDLRKVFEQHKIGFVSSSFIAPTFQATVLGKQELKLGWQPRNEILKTEVYPLTVWESLKFLEQPAPLRLIWNPANPTTILTAPSVNRPDEWKVIYKWTKGRQVLGFGKTLEVPLRKGENVFTVEASEEGVEGSKAITTTVVVITQ
jgi:PKD repeat protein